MPYISQIKSAFLFISIKGGALKLLQIAVRIRSSGRGMIRVEFPPFAPYFLL
jgi:hypothetical protein